MATDELSRAFAALADPTRRGLVQRLTREDVPLADLADEHDMSVQAISKHLSVLEQAGLVSRRQVGRRRPVTVEAEVIDIMTGWLARFRKKLDARYRRLDEVLAEMVDELPDGDTRPQRTTQPEDRSA